MGYKQHIKRVLDIVGALVLLVLVSPVLLTVAMALWWMQGKVIFTQVRPGFNESPFKIYKFITMEEGIAPDEERITPIGRFLRKHSLDELPQLWNVIKGDMSLVGPRPLLTEYLELYTSEHRKRHDMRPGITGLAQVSGRNLLSWNEKLDLDIHYVENVTLAKDIWILMRTILVLFHRGASKAAAEKFNGYSTEVNV